jgi:hypothetical protein
MSVIIGSPKDRTVSGAIAALAGKPTTLTPGAAIAILAEAAAAGPEKVAGRRATTALAKVVTDHAEPQVRVAAAKGLSHVQSDVSVRALRKVADKGADGQLLAAAAAGLTNLGGRADVKRLRGAAVRADWPLAAAQAAASARLLAHRVGASLHPEDATLRLPGEDAPVLPLSGRLKTRVEAVDLPVARTRATADLPWAALVPEDASAVGAFSCGDRTHVVLAGKDAEALTRAPGIAATLLGVNESMGTTFVRWVVLTHPDGEGLAVTVARPTGEVGFVGRGSIVDTVLSVTVDAVDRPGATAVHVTASLAGGKLEVDGRSERTITSPRRQPVPIPQQFDPSGPVPVADVG